jgi:hypothetical protein
MKNTSRAILDGYEGNQHCVIHVACIETYSHDPTLMRLRANLRNLNDESLTRLVNISLEIEQTSNVNNNTSKIMYIEWLANRFIIQLLNQRHAQSCL